MEINISESEEEYWSKIEYELENFDTTTFPLDQKLNAQTATERRSEIHNRNLTHMVTHESK